MEADGRRAMAAGRFAEAGLWFWRCVAAEPAEASHCLLLAGALAALDRPDDAAACRVAARALGAPAGDADR